MKNYYCGVQHGEIDFYALLSESATDNVPVTESCIHRMEEAIVNRLKAEYPELVIQVKASPRQEYEEAMIAIALQFDMPCDISYDKQHDMLEIAAPSVEAWLSELETLVYQVCLDTLDVSDMFVEMETGDFIIDDESAILENSIAAKHEAEFQLQTLSQNISDAINDYTNTEGFQESVHISCFGADKVKDEIDVTYHSENRTYEVAVQKSNGTSFYKQYSDIEKVKSGIDFILNNKKGEFEYKHSSSSRLLVFE